MWNPFRVLGDSQREKTLDAPPYNSYFLRMNSVLSEKGQITIPKRLRENLGLVPGTVLDFSEEDGRLVARRNESENPVRKWRGRGRLPGNPSVDDYIRRSRDDG